MYTFSLAHNVAYKFSARNPKAVLHADEEPLIHGANKSSGSRSGHFLSDVLLYVSSNLILIAAAQSGPLCLHLSRCRNRVQVI